MHQQDKQHTDQDKQEAQQLKALIGQHVLHGMGQPIDLHSVQVRHLWKDHYRVNVFVGLDAASTKVAHSFFLSADGSGNIIESTPKITRQHYPIAEGAAHHLSGLTP